MFIEELGSIHEMLLAFEFRFTAWIRRHVNVELYSCVSVPSIM